MDNEEASSGVKSGSQRWSVEQARQVLSELRQSGMPVSHFAKSRGIGVQRIFWWKKRLADWGEQGSQSAKPGAPVARFVPAAVGGSASAVAVRLPQGLVVEVADSEMVSTKWLCALVDGLARTRG